MAIKVSKIVTSGFRPQTDDPLLEQLNTGFKAHQEIVEEDYIPETGIGKAITNELNELIAHVYDGYELEKPETLDEYSDDLSKYVDTALTIKEHLVNAEILSTESTLEEVITEVNTHVDTALTIKEYLVNAEILSTESTIEEVITEVNTLLQPEYIQPEFNVSFNITAQDSIDLTQEQIKTMMDTVIEYDSTSITLTLDNQPGAPVFDVRIAMISESPKKEFSIFDTGTYDGEIPVVSVGTSSGTAYSFFYAGVYAAEEITIAYPVEATLAFTTSGGVE